MSIRRHGRGWEVRRQAFGVRFSKTVGSRKDAIELDRKVAERIADRAVGRTPRYTLEEALARWLEVDAAALKSRGNLLDKTRTIYPHIQGAALDQVSEVAARVKRDGLARGLAAATINRRLAILRRVANLAFRQWQWTERDLGAQIKLLPGERSRHRYLTPAEVLRLADATTLAGARDAILLAAMTGLRRGELLQLGPEHIRDGAIVLTETKSGRPRIVPLPPEALAIPIPLVITDAILRREFEEARQRAGLTDLRFHDLRHTYASWLVQAGVSLTAVRDLLGHSTLAVTSRYSHLADAHLRQAVGALPPVSVGQAWGKKKPEGNP